METKENEREEKMLNRSIRVFRKIIGMPFALAEIIFVVFMLSVFGASIIATAITVIGIVVVFILYIIGATVGLIIGLIGGVAIILSVLVVILITGGILFLTLFFFVEIIREIFKIITGEKKAFITNALYRNRN